MQFVQNKRRTPPSVIIVSLVDVLMVVLIFLVVSTTFKESQAYIELAASDNPEGQLNSDARPVLVTIPRDKNHVLIGGEEVPLEKLGAKLKAQVDANPELSLSIEADGKVDFEVIVQVRDAAKSAGVKNLNAFVQGKSQD
ncbi:MAG: biopolymer transporter ExbD [Verrucomicrobiota bacterium]|jgi:biopolymer transport protein ExbD|nr:biopolymer transporter ExbD [Verrucomicrobiota bacterium]